MCGSVSIWLDSLDDRADAEAIISDTPAAETHGWLVTESIPLGYGEHRTWPDGERSPGLSITTVFDKKHGLADEDFFRIWHGEHTPLSFVIHPLWLYVRNAVVRPVTDPAAAPRHPLLRVRGDADRSRTCSTSIASSAPAATTGSSRRTSTV